MIEVIEHLKNPREILLSLKEVMDKNSILFLSTPPGHYDEKLTNAYENPAHIHFFTPSSLNKLLSSIGFKKITFDSFSEMHPLQKKQSFVEKIIYSIKVFFKKTFINTQKKFYKKKYPYHLVGFTKLEI